MSGQISKQDIDLRCWRGFNRPLASEEFPELRERSRREEAQIKQNGEIASLGLRVPPGYDVVDREEVREPKEKDGKRGFLSRISFKLRKIGNSSSSKTTQSSGPAPVPPMEGSVSTPVVIPKDIDPVEGFETIFKWCSVGGSYKHEMLGQLSEQLGWDRTKTEAAVVAMEPLLRKQMRDEANAELEEESEVEEEEEFIYLEKEDWIPDTTDCVPTAPQVQTIFSGDVKSGVEAIFNEACVNPEGLSWLSLEYRKMQWSTLGAITDVNRWANTRKDCPEEAKARDDFKDVPQPDRIVTKVAGKVEVNQAGRVVTSDKKVRQPSMTSKAKEFAEKIKDSPKRIRAFFSHGHTNPKWAAAVARALTRINFISKSAAEIALVTKPVQQALGRATVDAVAVWASKDVGPLVESSAIDTTRFMEEVDKPTLTGHSKIVLRAISSSGLTRCMHRANCCIYCLLRELDVEVPLREGKYGDKDLTYLGSLNLKSLLANDIDSYLHAVAAIHNREQHSTNGNIEFTVMGKAKRYDVANGAFLRAWDLPAIRTHRENNHERLITSQEERLSQVNFAGTSNTVSVSYGANGTAHQVIYPVKLHTSEGLVGYVTKIARQAEANVLAEHKVELDKKLQSNKLAKDEHARMLAEEKARVRQEAEETISLAQTVSNTSIKTVSDYYRQSDSKDEIEYRPISYIGVGEDAKYEHGVLTLTPTGIELMTNAKNTENKGIGINDQRAYNIARFTVGANILGTGIGEFATAEKADWRALGLKAAVYESMRENVLSQPTGQDWAVTKKEVPNLRYVFRAPAINAIMVSARYLDASLRKGDFIGVETNRQISRWYLNDEGTVIISLNEDSGDRDLAWAVWTLCHLPLGMVEVYEEHAIKTPVSTECEVFLRNASAILTRRDIKRIVFVLPDSWQQTVFLEGVELNVSQPSRLNEVEEPAHPFLFTRILENMLERVLSGQESVKGVFNTVFSRYCSGSMNWGEIHMLVSFLITRFPRKPDFTKKGGAISVGRVPKEVGKKLMANSGAAGEEITYQPGYEWYDHDFAVTAFNQVFTTAKKAKANPCVTIGSWSNVAELAISLGICLYNCTNAETTDTVKMGLNGSNLDAIDRAAYMRRAIEEFGSASGIREDVVTPTISTRVSAAVALAIKDSQKVLTLKNYCCSHLGGETLEYSWSVNYKHASSKSLTGMRLHPNLYRSEVNRQIIAWDITPTMKLDTTAGSPTFGYLCQVARGCDDEVIERVLTRIDYTRTGAWAYKTWPDGNLRVEGSFNLHSTLYSDTLAAAGWNGFFKTEDRTWAYCPIQRVKDLSQENYSTLAVKPELISALNSPLIAPPIWYSIGPEGANAPTTHSLYLDTEEGFPLLASTSPSPGVRKGALPSAPESAHAPADPGKSSRTPSDLSDYKATTEKAIVKGGEPGLPDTLLSYSVAALDPKKEEAAPSAAPKPEEKLPPPKETHKPGTTAKDAAHNPDHRAAVDEL